MRYPIISVFSSALYTEMKKKQKTFIIDRQALSTVGDNTKIV